MMVTSDIKKRTAIVWLRRDLRLADNPALRAALASHDMVLPLYIHAPEEESPWPPGAASNWWLHHSLQQLDKELRKLGSRLFLARGSSYECLKHTIRKFQADSVLWNRVYEPALIDRDSRIKSQLKAKGLTCHSFNASLLNEPQSIMSQNGTPYKVFSAYWRKSQSGIYSISQPHEKPERINSPYYINNELTIDDLELLPSHPWCQAFHNHWQPGENGARQKLETFIAEHLSGYKVERDIPGIAGTSRLSPHLRFGEISPGQAIWSALTQATAGTKNHADLERFFSEIGWREFAYYLMYHFPHSINESLDTRFDTAGWVDANQNQEFIERWKKGQTGIPIVDAGMRELWHTGWMHNRVRMIVASILTKNLGIHWLEGARWFWDTLVDADLACNTMGWQWTAGCGVDAAPYFRIFSPSRQAERFDPQGNYIKKWIPELAKADQKTLMSGISSQTQESAYPKPMINVSETRKQALTHWSTIRATEKAITRKTA